MPQLTIPLGNKISTAANKKTIQIQIPNTKFWIRGEQKESKLWDTYLVNPDTGYEDILKKDITTSLFTLYSNVILKTPFPYSGKRAENSDDITKFIKKTIKQHTNGKQHRTR